MIGERRRTVGPFIEVGTEKVSWISPVVSSQARHGYADAEHSLGAACGGIQSDGEMVSTTLPSLNS
jgi:hypothetical protein